MKKIFTVLSVLILFLRFSGTAEYSSAEENEISHTLCTVLAEASTGTVISGENENTRVPQGTLCKLMTVLLTAEEIDTGKLTPDTVLTASANANSQSGAVIWLMQGEKINVDELLKAVIIGNANDAAVVLAEHIGDDEQGFIDMMNARAFELGMRNTVYKSCTGADIEGQYSTAEDTAVLAAELLKYDFLKKYFTVWMDRVRDGQTELVNENRLVRTYEGITGMKAGHSEQSGFTLVLTAERNGNAFIAVVLGCEDKDERFGMGKSLLSEGFSSYKVTTPEFSGEFLKPVKVRGGADKAVGIIAGSLRELVVPKNSGEMSTAVLLPEYIDAPVRKGQVIGKIGFYNGDTLLYETNLLAAEEVKKMDLGKAIHKYLCIMYK